MSKNLLHWHCYVLFQKYNLHLTLNLTQSKRSSEIIFTSYSKRWEGLGSLATTNQPSMQSYLNTGKLLSWTDNRPSFIHWPCMESKWSRSKWSKSSVFISTNKLCPFFDLTGHENNKYFHVVTENKKQPSLFNKYYLNFSK